MRIGIFGGCFNPPHQMHTQIAEDLVKKKYVDKVIFVPTGNSYQKKSLVAFEHRIKMLKQICGGKEYLMVSDYECRGNLVYTYQTLNHFKNLYPEDEICFICGTDNFNELDSWREYQYILKQFTLIVLKRGGDDISKISLKYRRYNPKVIVADIAENFISSTYIREKIKKNKLDEIRQYIDSKVIDYIVHNQLY